MLEGQHYSKCYAAFCWNGVALWIWGQRCHGKCLCYSGLFRLGKSQSGPFNLVKGVKALNYSWQILRQIYLSFSCSGSLMEPFTEIPLLWTLWVDEGVVFSSWRKITSREGLNGGCFMPMDSTLRVLALSASANHFSRHGRWNREGSNITDQITHYQSSLYMTGFQAWADGSSLTGYWRRTIAAPVQGLSYQMRGWTGSLGQTPVTQMLATVAQDGVWALIRICQGTFWWNGFNIPKKLTCLPAPIPGGLYTFIKWWEFRSVNELPKEDWQSWPNCIDIFKSRFDRYR